MPYTPATILPSTLKTFQLQTPTYPNPRLNAPISAIQTTLIVSAPPLDENGAVVTGSFHAGIGNYDGYVETVWVPAGAVSVDGLTWTGVVRGIRLTGLDYTTSDATLAVSHDSDTPIVCNITAVLFNLMRGAMNGAIASGGLNWILGDGTDSDISVVAYNADTNKPKFRYNATTSAWEYSNDGTTFQPFGTGSGLTASTGVLINSGDIQLDQTTNAAATAMVAANSSGLNKFIDSKTANATISSGEAVSFDGISRLVKADGNDLNPFGLFAGVATGAGTAGNPMNYATSGIVTVPAFTLADRVNCRSWTGEQSTTTNTTTDSISATTAWRAQAFIPATGQDNIYQVAISITDSSLSATMVAQIYATTGTAPNAIPTGAALGTSGNITTFGSGVITFTFTTPIAVTPGTSYAIVIKLTARASGSFAWNYNNTSAYANGNSATSSDSGANWTAEASYDRYFVVTYKGLAGEPVFISDTAGALVLTPGTYQLQVGTIIDSTHILLKPQNKSIYATLSIPGGAAATVATTIQIGFRPRMVFCYFNTAFGGTVSASQGSTGFWVMAGPFAVSGCVTGGGAMYINGGSTQATNNSYAQLGYWSGYGESSKVTTTATVGVSASVGGADTIVITRGLTGITTSGSGTLSLLILE